MPSRVRADCSLIGFASAGDTQGARETMRVSRDSYRIVTKPYETLRKGLPLRFFDAAKFAFVLHGLAHLNYVSRIFWSSAPSARLTWPDQRLVVPESPDEWPWQVLS